MKCKICGKEFAPSNGSRTICSDECRKQGRRLNAKEYAERKRKERRSQIKMKTCEVCGKEFMPRTSLQVRCSKSCTVMLGNQYKRDNCKKRKEELAESKKRKKSKAEELVEFNTQALAAGKTYGKHELQPFLEKQSIEMAKRRREMEIEWERKRKNGNQ